MQKFNNRMYQDSYVRNLVGKIAFTIIVFIFCDRFFGLVLISTILILLNAHHLK